MSEVIVEPEPTPLEIVVGPPPAEVETVIEPVEAPMQVGVTLPASTSVVISDVGLPGAQGPTGPVGPPGEAGVGDQAAVVQHVDDATPHPVYDDGPSFSLLYQNAKV